MPKTPQDRGGSQKTDEAVSVAAPAPVGPSTPEDRPRPMGPGRRIGARILKAVLLLLIPLGAAAAGLWVYANGGRHIETENAYVKSRIVTVSSNLDARVERVLVGPNQVVQIGDPLFVLESEAQRIALDEAEAALAVIRQDVAALKAEYREVEAEIAEARVAMAFREKEWRRQKDLYDKNVGTAAKLDEAEGDLASAKQRVATLGQKLAKVRVALGGDVNIDPEQTVAWREAAMQRERAALDLAWTEVHAPVEGNIGPLKLEEGEWLEAGDPAMVIVESGRVWIEANYKETQLTHVKPGQPVILNVDTYPDHTWRGTVAGIAAATGAEFAVLPPQNASGNWVKVVQRLPVRIELDPDQPADLPRLRPGMSVAASIDTGVDRPILIKMRQIWADWTDNKP